MATKVDVINGALVLMGQPPMAGPSDTATWVVRAVNRYPAVTRALLEVHPWNFARVREELQLLPEASGGREYSYNKPAKCLRICVINNTGDVSDDEWHDYDDGDGKIHADYDALFMWFVSSDYLIKEGSWPQVFADAVSAEIAARLSPVVTKDRGQRGDLNQIARDALRRAKSWDAAQKPFQQNPMGKWARSRRSGSRYNTEGN